MNKLIDSLKWFGAGTGALVPAWNFFQSQVPPLFPEIGILLIPVAAAIAFIVGSYNSAEPREGIGLAPSIRKGARCIAVSLIILISYRVLLNNWTVLDPQNFRERYQIGFGEANWNLTTTGAATKAALGTSDSTRLMLANRCFAPGGPELIWKGWTIDTAGVILILLYVAGFTLWTTGFAVLSQYRGKSNRHG